MPTSIDTGSAGTNATVVTSEQGIAAPAKKATKKTVKKAPAAAPAGMSAQDWRTVTTIARQYNIDPKVLVAIGVHETGWGTQGAGQQGFYLGVGVPDSGQIQTQYQGLKAQVTEAAKILSNYGVHTIHDLASGVLAPHNGQVRYASDPNWTQGVVSAYNNLAGTHIQLNATVLDKQLGTSSGVAAGATSTPQPLSVKQYLDNPDVAATYGYLAAYLKDKEIGPILAKAAKNGWGENELLGALEKTKWWKNTDASARSWQSQQRLDPATAKQRLGQMTGQVQQLAQSTLGAALDPKRAGAIANTALAQNWSQAQLQDAVGAEFHYSAAQKAYGGLAGQTLDSLRKQASDYLVPLSDQTLQQWTQGVLKGTYKDTDFNDYLKSQAQSLYPTLQKPLDQGVTVKQFLNPYAQLVQSTLGQNPDGLDWMDPKWSKALNTTTPDGQRAPMSLSDWGTYLRGLPEYQYTDQAKQAAQSFSTKIAQTFGRVM